MKGKLHYYSNGSLVEKDVNYIPVRYILAIALAVLETLTILGIVVSLCYCVPYFYIFVFITQLSCVVKIIASKDNPDYKIPWLVFVLIVPIAGFMLYFLFYSRVIDRKYMKRLKLLTQQPYPTEEERLYKELRQESVLAHNQAKMLCNISNSHLFSDTKQIYFKLGEVLHKALLADLQNAEKWRFMVLVYNSRHEKLNNL